MNKLLENGVIHRWMYNEGWNDCLDMVQEWLKERAEYFLEEEKKKNEDTPYCAGGRFVCMGLNRYLLGKVRWEKQREIK